MKYRFILIVILLFAVLSIAIYANSSSAVLSSGGSDLKYSALLLFTAFAALFPLFNMWDDGQNGS